jgi:hypothetical protein
MEQPDVETRVHRKIMDLGPGAIFEFTEDENRYYRDHVEPILRAITDYRTTAGLVTSRLIDAFGDVLMDRGIQVEV